MRPLLRVSYETSLLSGRCTYDGLCEKHKMVLIHTPQPVHLQDVGQYLAGRWLLELLDMREEVGIAVRVGEYNKVDTVLHRVCFIVRGFVGDSGSFTIGECL